MWVKQIWFEITNEDRVKQVIQKYVNDDYKVASS